MIDSKFTKIYNNDFYNDSSSANTAVAFHYKDIVSLLKFAHSTYFPKKNP